MSSAQAFCLRRNNHSSDMSEHFERMFKEESLVDVTLSCKDGSIRAHKMVLSACSSYFKNIFSKFINPYQYPVVIMKDVPFADLRAIVEFIYRGEVFVPQEQLASVLKSAESLKVKGLSDVNVNKSQLQLPRQQQHISVGANVPLQHISSGVHGQAEFAATQSHNFLLTKQG
ncbi:protein tramtrack, beta isoform-like isoform X2 [Panonychus citri]|uniref:protein tramtrack, beta isoform-like isoform X2 n=1 Tax=Panonychus citri TaxID=50023 RepID=UPI00230734C4|nr:protein tramtrack, beta isoform-like isoform X2 [Panonychus citri]XP_053211902.1 protein tramtrack, beta isoform-like isoform X2 [Panonychus citri]